MLNPYSSASTWSTQSTAQPEVLPLSAIRLGRPPVTRRPPARGGGHRTSSRGDAVRMVPPSPCKSPEADHRKPLPGSPDAAAEPSCVSPMQVDVVGKAPRLQCLGGSL